MLRIDLITGFLGAGKTTFLTEYAKYLISRGMRIGILEYDYGAVNIDMVLLGKLRSANCELEMIDASCDREGIIRRLRAKLIAMAMSGYDRVILEPSGVFDMDMFFDLLRDEPLDEWYEIGSVITVVNAKLRGLLDAESAYILASQAAGAGTILLSRTQLATKAEIEATKQMLEDAAKNISCRKFKPVYVDKPWNEFTDADYENIMQSGYVIDD